MNGRQRFLRALRGETVDRVVRGEIRLDEGFIRELLGFRQRRASIGPVEQRAAVAALDLDLITVDATTGPQGLAAEVDRAGMRALADWRDTGLALVVRVDGPLNRVVKALGPQAAVTRLTSRRTKPLGMADMLTVRMRGVLSRVVTAAATAVLVVDDSPEIGGQLVSPEVIRQFYLPQLAVFVHSARGFRLPVVLHVAPWQWDILDDLVRLAPAALQGFGGQALPEVRAQVGPEMCLWGNVDTSWLAEPHSSEESRDEVKQMLDAGLPRYVFGSADGLRAGLNPQTVIAVYDALNGV
jgi:uroporphyrinogen-III decarboxylase